MQEKREEPLPRRGKKPNRLSLLGESCDIAGKEEEAEQGHAAHGAALRLLPLGATEKPLYLPLAPQELSGTHSSWRVMQAAALAR